MQYQRILFKLSGELLAEQGGGGISTQRLSFYAEEIRNAYELGVSIIVVVGGGNIYRGRKRNNIPHIRADQMGILATIINGIALQSALDALSVPTRLMSALTVEKVCPSYSPSQALRHLHKNRVVILVAGLAQPHFTTDTAAALRAIELQADALLKGTKVDGIYTEDPLKTDKAVLLPQVSFSEAYKRKLRVMDTTAFTLCEENNLPIVVFDATPKGQLVKIIQGESIGSLVR